MTQHFTPHGLSSRATPRPPRAVCEQIGQDVADQYGIAFEEVLYRSTVKAKLARTEAWVRIAEATGCSGAGLADAWGVDRTTVVGVLTKARRTGRLAVAA